MLPWDTVSHGEKRANEAGNGILLRLSNREEGIVNEKVWVSRRDSVGRRELHENSGA